MCDFAQQTKCDYSKNALFYLICVIPKYGFPVDVVELQIYSYYNKLYKICLIENKVIEMNFNLA